MKHLSSLNNINLLSSREQLWKALEYDKWLRFSSWSLRTFHISSNKDLSQINTLLKSFKQACERSACWSGNAVRAGMQLDIIWLWIKVFNCSHETITKTCQTSLYLLSTKKSSLWTFTHATTVTLSHQLFFFSVYLKHLSYIYSLYKTYIHIHIILSSDVKDLG